MFPKKKRFGTVGEKSRAKRFRDNFPDCISEFPLINNGLRKNNCFQILIKNNIEMPMMYKMGYKNNNCIGCVKGGAGYWNKIRRDFPEVFNRMAKMERKLNVTICKIPDGKGNMNRIFLDELPENYGHYNSEDSISCGVVCQF